MEKFSSFACYFFDILWGTGSCIPHLKAVKNGKYEKRGLSGGSTPSFCQDFLKSNNLLHKQGFVDFQTKTTVHAKRIQGRILIIAQFVIILGGLRSVIHIN